MQPLFRSRRDRLDRLRRQREDAVKAAAQRSSLTTGVSQTCPGCGGECQNQELVKTEYVCPHCGYHLPIGAYLRLSLLLDPFTFQELWPELTAPNALDFPGYEQKLAAQREKTALSDAAVVATGKLDGRQAVFAVLDSRFFMGSMGVAVFTHPTTGGVTASFASLGDITLAEPGALIGFAGPRVIQQTIGQELPEGFQRAEYLEEHGFVDQIVPRRQMRQVLSQLLFLHRKGVMHR